MRKKDGSMRSVASILRATKQFKKKSVKGKKKKASALLIEGILKAEDRLNKSPGNSPGRGHLVRNNKPKKVLSQSKLERRYRREAELAMMLARGQTTLGIHTYIYTHISLFLSCLYTCMLVFTKK